jgi:integrase
VDLPMTCPEIDYEAAMTTATVRSLALPTGRQDKTFWDDVLPGFGLRLRAGGGRSWVVQYDFGTATRRITIGPAAAVHLGEARERAKDILAKVRLGQDPAMQKIEARLRASETLGALLPRYLAYQRARLRPRSFDQVEHHLLVHARTLHSHPIATISQRAVAIRLHEIAETAGPTTANLVRASLSACFGWMQREGLLETNPVLNTNKAAVSGPRERVLSGDELAEIWRALGDDQFGGIVKLLTFTGQRRDEIGSLRWSEVDLEKAIIRLPAARTKNKTAHEIPLSPAALAILQAQPRRTEADGSPRDLIFGFRRGGFSDWSKRKIVLDQRILAARKASSVADSLPSWRLHDLRRTCSTVMHDWLGVLPHVVEAVLNHTGGHKAGPAGVYNRASQAGQPLSASAASSRSDRHAGGQAPVPCGLFQPLVRHRRRPDLLQS